MIDRGIDTIVSFAPGTARAVCPGCGARLVAVGTSSRSAVTDAVSAHEPVCGGALVEPCTSDRLDELVAALDAIRAGFDQGLVRIQELGAA